jgi:hypothetical protein
VLLFALKIQFYLVKTVQIYAFLNVLNLFMVIKLAIDHVFRNAQLLIQFIIMLKIFLEYVFKFVYLEHGD